MPTPHLAKALLLALALSNAALAQEVPAKPEIRPLRRHDGKPADLSKPVKVFILMGQSNMVGFGQAGPETAKGTLAFYIKEEKRYPFAVDETGAWVARQDVRCAVWTGDGKSKPRADWLKPGFGARAGVHFGPELGFGHVIGEALDAPVLLIKVSCGNRSLGWDLLPPGSPRFVHEGKVHAGYGDKRDNWPVDPAKGIATEPPAWVDKNGKPIQWHGGLQYDLDTGNAKRILADLATHYPGATSHEIAGFVWFQGHKDQGDALAGRYEQNLVALINALRKDFSAPKAPFVLATGCGNPGTEGGGLKVALAQLAMNDAKRHPDFAGNVRCVDIRGLWPKEAESPSRQGYHYYWNGAVYMDIGMALGQAMADLMKK